MRIFNHRPCSSRLPGIGAYSSGHPSARSVPVVPHKFYNPEPTTIMVHQIFPRPKRMSIRKIIAILFSLGALGMLPAMQRLCAPRLSYT